MDTPRIKISGRLVGGGCPCYVVAEIGINHNGDMELARRAIEAANRAGADAVKFQNYRTEDFISDCELTYAYRSQGREVVESQFDMFKRYELNPEDLSMLKQHCDHSGIDFHSTPTGPDGLRDLLDLGVGVLKNGSDFLGNTELVRAMGESGLPVVLSTGMATEDEIAVAVRVLNGTGNTQFVLLHCVSNYPAGAEDMNLRRMTSLRERFGCMVGFSDHSRGPSAALGAVAMGAVWIEKHFTLDHDLPGPDHWFSCDEEEFSELVQAVRRMEVLLGSPKIEPSPSEKASRQMARLSCAAARPLKEGTILTREDIIFCRPGTGLAPDQSKDLVGGRLNCDIPRNHMFKEEDIA